MATSAGHNPRSPTDSPFGRIPVPPIYGAPPPPGPFLGPQFDPRTPAGPPNAGDAGEGRPAVPAEGSSHGPEGEPRPGAGPAPAPAPTAHPTAQADPTTTDLLSFEQMSKQLSEQLAKGGYDPATMERYFSEEKAPIESGFMGAANQAAQYLARQGLGSSGLNISSASALTTNKSAVEGQAKLKAIDLATEKQRQGLLDKFTTQAMALQPELQKYGIDVSKTIATMQMQAQLEALQAQLNAQSQAGMGQLLGSGLGFLALLPFMQVSDRNAKKNIKRIKDGVVEFEYKKPVQRELGLPGGKQIGVIAQEIAKSHPDAVLRHPSGYLAVDYGKLD